MTELNQRLSQTRRARKLRQHQVAEHLDVSLGAVSQWEQGKTKPNMRNLVLLAKLLNVSLDWLLSGVETASELKTAHYQASHNSDSLSAMSVEGLDSEEKQLIAAYSKLPNDWQSKVLQILQILAERHDNKS
jgi:transcriptional regulator with XRE-family HTH domain